MAGKTTWLETAVLNKVLRGTDFTVTAVYVGLKIAGVEVSGGGYARQAVTFGAPAPDAQGMACVNTADILFPQATANWGTPDSFALFDAPTAGNELYDGALSASKPIESQDQFKIPAGQLAVTED